MNRWTIWAICLATIVVVLAVIYWVRSDSVYAINGPATQAAVLKIIPIGSGVEFAKATMEARGFTCRMEYNQKYSGDDPAGGYIEYPAADFLYCDSERWAGLLRSKRWQVMFPIENEKVVSVAVGVSINAV